MASSLAAGRVWGDARAALLGALGIVALLIAWQIVAAHTHPMMLARPLEVLRAIPAIFTEDDLVGAYFQTMRVYVVSFVFSIAAGVLFGVVTSLNRPLRYLTDPFVVMLYATPSIVLIPLLVLWFGIGVLPKATLVFLAAFFPVVINTQLGIDEMGPSFRELGKAFGANRRELMSKILLPAIIPHVATAVRIVTPRAFVALLAGEMLISVGGIGSMVIGYSRSFRADAYFATVVVIIATSALLIFLTRRLEARLTPWREGGGA